MKKDLVDCTNEAAKSLMGTTDYRQQNPFLFTLPTFNPNTIQVKVGEVERVGLSRTGNRCWQFDNITRKEGYQLNVFSTQPLPTRINEKLFIDTMEKLYAETDWGIYGVNLYITKLPRKKNWSVIGLKFLRTGFDSVWSF